LGVRHIINLGLHSHEKACRMRRQVSADRP
jgi:hypothetical protein